MGVGRLKVSRVINHSLFPQEEAQRGEPGGKKVLLLVTFLSKSGRDLESVCVCVCVRVMSVC